MEEITVFIHVYVNKFCTKFRVKIAGATYTLECDLYASNLVIAQCVITSNKNVMLFSCTC